MDAVDLPKSNHPTSYFVISKIGTTNQNGNKSIDQEVDNDWPLFIEDHHYRKHKIILSPGEVFFYEGARLKHGRPLPLEGQKYANIFCHFKIADK